MNNTPTTLSAAMSFIRRLSFSVLACFSAHSYAEDKAQWQSLFNGEDLQGWTVKIRNHALGDNYANTFRVEQGLLTVSYDGYEDFDNRFGHLFYQSAYSHYRLRLQYRFIGEQIHDGAGWARRNNGIMIHSQSPQSMSLEQEFPVSIEVQLLGGDGKRSRSTANMCSPGTHIMLDNKLQKRHCIESDSATFHGDQWVTVEVLVRGAELVEHFINGERVMVYQKPQYDNSAKDAQALVQLQGGQLSLSAGFIALQSESHPTQFRNIEILPLPGN